MDGSRKTLISVVVPAFNRVEYIRETVESVLSQDYDQVELIVVDDGSTDGTYEILLEYAEKGDLKLLTHPNRANLGQSVALNRALENASGELIAILDSDDIFLPGKLRSQAEYLQAHPEVGLVYGMGEAVDENGRWLYNILSPDHIEPNDPNAVLLDCYFSLPVNALVRRSFYERIGGFEEGFRAAQDHDMLIRLAESTKFAFIPVKVFQYRRHSDSISNKGQRKRWENGFRILHRAQARYPYKKSTIRKRRALLNFRMAQVCWRENKSITALGYLLRSGALDPIRALKVLTGSEKAS
ncbi:glycosyltransferase [Marinobacter sp. ATCH36]|uniref:glycosyltransferase n=1 Tax=Marinobacter sp. ATCH36 TaxID=2945106 RepID=UPI0020202AD6|nr:glycosyltransferase [Marinobacter sp. ATCH36]MCL7945686.1 glycosyltransferase [Marinobacter sp. ATCH36]